MNSANKKSIWKLIQSHGDHLKNILEPHPYHPHGRNPYAHICSLINKKYSCSYKDLSDDKVEELRKFILGVNK